MGRFDPFTPPWDDQRRSLGSLAQSARTQQIYRAQRTLIVVGVLMMTVGSYLRQNIPGEVFAAIAQHNIHPAKQPKFVRERTLHLSLVYGGLVAAGTGLATLGLFVKWFPVPFTPAGMLIYGSALVAFALVHPGWLLHEIPLVLSLVVFVPLAGALKAGRAYQRERRKSVADRVMLE